MATERRINVPENVTVEVDEGAYRVTVSSGETELSRVLDYPAVSITQEEDAVVIRTESKKRDDAAVVGTYASHIRNMITGVTDGFEYTLEGFYAHFPMNLSVEGDEFVIKNFIGERTERRVRIPETVSVSVDGEHVSVTGPDKEAVGQTAANIEQACYRGNRDPRKFQDGVYITGKGVIGDE